MAERIRVGLLRTMVWAAFVACVLLVWVAGAAGGTVRLKGTAVVRPGAEVLLRDVADLEEADDALGETVIIQDAAAAREGAPWVVLEIADVRAALEREGFGGGRVALSGSRCVVRFAGVGIDDDRKERAERQTARRPSVVDLSGPPTVRTRVVELLERMFGVEDRSALRVLFQERDEQLLGMEEWGRRVVVRPDSTGSGSRVLIEVRVLSGDEMVASETIEAEVEVRRRVVVMAEEVDRQGRIEEGMVREVEMWVSPRGSASPSSANRLIGQRARRPLRSGQIVRSADVEPAIVVERGALVSVLCLKGGIGVQAPARALEDGRAGETIECRLIDSRKGFRARVEGPGRVVMVLDGQSGSPG